MQTLTLDEENELMEGVIYDPDFFQDYSNMRLDDLLFEEVNLPNREPEAIPASCSDAERSRNHELLIESMDEETNRNRKAQKKKRKKDKELKKEWKRKKKKHPNSKHYKTFKTYKIHKANKNFNRIIKDLIGE